MGKLLYEDLTHNLIGALYNVFNELGYGHTEDIYQRAYAEELKERDCSFVREKFLRIKYKNKSVGRYFVDFVIEDKLVVEMKIAKEFYDRYIHQVLGYLQANNLHLGILALITPKGVRVKRIIN